MPNQRFPVVDGISPSFADLSCTLDVDGAPLVEMVDVKSINTSTSLEVGEQRGLSGGRVLNRTTGSEKNEASWSLYHSGFEKFLDVLSSRAPRRGDDYLLRFVHFSIDLIWTPPGSTALYNVLLEGCFYAGRAINPAEGIDASMADVALNPIGIVDIVKGKRCRLL